MIFYFTCTYRIKFEIDCQSNDDDPAMEDSFVEFFEDDSELPFFF